MIECALCGKPLDDPWYTVNKGNNLVHWNCYIYLGWFEDLRNEWRVVLEDAPVIERQVDNALFFNNTLCSIYHNLSWF